MPQENSTGRLRIACVQMQSYDSEQRDRALRKGLEYVDAASAGGADIVLLPETFYPSYYLGGIDPAWSWKEAFDALSEKAAERSVYLAAGLALGEGGVLRNAALLWGPDGKEILRTYKSNLWHFDGRYVEPGRSFAVADTPWGKVGMMICADGRIPEIARILALKGARLILDPTNLVAAERNPSRLSSAQLDYMLCSRAAENGLWIAVANKVGLEAESVLSCGGSCVIDPKGEKIASVGPVDEEILFASIDLGSPSPALSPRSPEKYGIISRKREETQAFRNLFLPLPAPPDDELFVGVAQFSFSSSVDFTKSAKRFLARGADQGASFLSLPGVVSCSKQDLLAALSPSLAGEKCIAACALRDGDDPSVRIVLFGGEGEIGSRTESSFTPVETEMGRIGAVFGPDGWNPEPIRCLMLEGAEIVLWVCSFENERERAILEKIARTRASENRICIVGSFAGEARESFVVSPSGAIVASALSGKTQAVFAMLRRSECLGKTVVPGTNIVSGRLPELYRPLTEALPL